MRATSLLSADLSSAIFSYAHFVDMGVSRETGGHVIEITCDFRCANLSSALLTNISHLGCNFEGAKLRDADISESNLYFAQLTKEQLLETRGRPATLPRGVKLPRSYGKPRRSKSRGATVTSGVASPSEGTPS
jgi:uncharacterized protein YjbI with pentapeptide repeats